MSGAVQQGKRLNRYRKVAALADAPTPMRRAVAGIVAGSFAFAITYLLFGLAAGLQDDATLLCAAAFSVAAGYAAVTLERGLAVVYALLAVIWLCLEVFIMFLSAIAASVG